MNLRSLQIVRSLVLPTALTFALQAAPVAPAAAAEEAVAADPKHYTVEFENEKVRVLRIKYGPSEKSVMHHHPANVAVFLTDGKARFTLPDGSAADAEMKAGTVQWDAGGDHLPQNPGEKSFELILVELK
jgi:quercetin dioxygenase-like cupin family protein